MLTEFLNVNVHVNCTQLVPDHHRAKQNYYILLHTHSDTLKRTRMHVKSKHTFCVLWFGRSVGGSRVRQRETTRESERRKCITRQRWLKNRKSLQLCQQHQQLGCFSNSTHICYYANIISANVFINNNQNQFNDR